ncbi:hypothetical protein D3C73_1378990 [compost metagenome]
MRHAEVTGEIVLRVPALLMAHHRHGDLSQFGDAAYDGLVVAEQSITVKLDKISEDGLNIVKRRRTLWTLDDLNLLFDA